MEHFALGMLEGVGQTFCHRAFCFDMSVSHVVSPRAFVSFAFRRIVQSRIVDTFECVQNRAAEGNFVVTG